MGRILIGNIKGPQGEQGEQGIQGPVGPQGPQGPLPPLINNALATVAGVAALDAVMGGNLQSQITSLNSDLGGKVVRYTFVFGSENMTETFLFGTTYANIPMLIGMRIGSAQIIFSRITHIDVGVDRIIVTRDAAVSYAGTAFDITLFISS